MEQYAKILMYAIPGFVALIGVEWIVGALMGKKVNRIFDTVSSLSSGMTNILKDILGIAVIIISYSTMVKHVAVFSLPNSPWVYFLAFVGKDFAQYWSHRWEHEINVFWNRHVVHHSSEEFNLSCALRQNISAIVRIFFFLYLPLAILGVPRSVIGVIAPLHLFAQFWYHTTLIKKMGFLEYIIVTPSHHRVHHAINDVYIDKNYSAIFIIWDKMFGTFQKELKEIPPIYGVKKPVSTWNPILINYQHMWQIAKDSWRTKNWWDKIRVWFMPTGWRPADVAEADPIHILPPEEQVKYDTNPSPIFNAYAIIHLVCMLSFMMILFYHIAEIPFYHMLTGVAYLFVSVAAYTTIMDRTKRGFEMLIFQLIFGILLFVFSMLWASSSWGIAVQLFLVVYILYSFSAGLYFNQENSLYRKEKIITT